jgi:CO dehydrogenase/acetyl-CoA synthase epsilon subunit
MSGYEEGMGTGYFPEREAKPQSVFVTLVVEDIEIVDILGVAATREFAKALCDRELQKRGETLHMVMPAIEWTTLPSMGKNDAVAYVGDLTYIIEEHQVQG